MLGGPDPYDYLGYIVKKTPWSKWNAEAQAALVEDYSRQERIDAAGQAYQGHRWFNCGASEWQQHGLDWASAQTIRARSMNEVHANRGSFGRDDLNARPSVPHVLPARGMGVKFGQRRR